MEITLEKIELVRDRTGVSYKEAKDALEAADGSVVDAIIAIEETIDGGVATGVTRDVAAKKDELVEKMKDVAKKGGVSKIRVTKDDETILNIPLVAGILGAALAPWGAVAGTVAALGFKCKLELIKDDGSVVDLSEKAGDAYETAKEKGASIYSDIKEKAPGNINLPDNFDDIKTRAQDTFNELKEKAPGNIEEFKTRAQGTINDIRDKANEKTDNPKFDEFKSKFDDLWEKGGDAINKAKETVSKPVKSFKEGVRDEMDDIAEDIESVNDDVQREMSQLEKDLLEMQKAAAEGIKEFEDDIKH